MEKPGGMDINTWLNTGINTRHTADDDDDRPRQSNELRPSVVREIRAKHQAGGYSFGKLAAAYGLSASTVYNLVTRKTYDSIK